jgi:hypothetical protein
MKQVLLALTLFAAPSLAFGETKVLLLAGQSNMAGEGKVAELPSPYNRPQPAVKFWKDQRWTSLQGGFGDGDKAALFGPEVTFGFALRHFFPNDEIFLVKYGLTSTDLAVQWNPNGSGQCYNRFKNAVLAAMKNLSDAGKSPRIGGMIWLQGENDALALRLVLSVLSRGEQAAWLRTIRHSFSRSHPLAAQPIESGDRRLARGQTLGQSAFDAGTANPHQKRRRLQQLGYRLL